MAPKKNNRNTWGHNGNVGGYHASYGNVGYTGHSTAYASTTMSTAYQNPNWKGNINTGWQRQEYTKAEWDAWYAQQQGHHKKNEQGHKNSAKKTNLKGNSKVEKQAEQSSSSNSNVPSRTPSNVPSRTPSNNGNHRGVKKRVILGSLENQSTVDLSQSDLDKNSLLKKDSTETEEEALIGIDGAAVKEYASVDILGSPNERGPSAGGYLNLSNLGTQSSLIPNPSDYLKSIPKDLTSVWDAAKSAVLIDVVGGGTTVVVGSPGDDEDSVRTLLIPPNGITSPTATSQKELLVSFERLTVNLILCGFGAGMLSLPWSTAGAGIMNSGVWNFLVLALSYYICMMLVKTADKHKVYTMEGLLRKHDVVGISGQSWEKLCGLTIWATFWFTLTGYFIIMSDSFVQTWNTGIIGSGIDRRIPIAMGTIVVLPLCFLSQKALASSSSFAGCCSNLFVVFAIVFNWYTAGNTRADKVCILGFTEGNMTYVSSICMSMIIQPCVLPMYETMEGRSPEKFSKSMLLSFGILWAIFTAFSAFAYMTFGSDIQGNVLNNLPQHVWYAFIARAGMAIVCIGIYPLMLNPMLASLAVEGKCRVAIVTAVVFSTAIGACIFTDLGRLNVLCGAMSTFFFIALFPVVIGLGEDMKRSVLYSIFTVGTISAILGLIYSDNHASTLIQRCVWSMGSGGKTSTTNVLGGEF